MDKAANFIVIFKNWKKITKNKIIILYIKSNWMKKRTKNGNVYVLWIEVQKPFLFTCKKVN